MAGILMEATEFKAHSLLGASSSHRWLECTPSAVAETRYPDEGSDFAREGSLAHAMCARSLKKLLDRPYEDEDAEIAELKEAYYDPEMDEHVAGYVDFVTSRYEQSKERARRIKDLQPEIMVEQRLDYSRWAPEGFGTGDCVIAGGGMVEVIDFKYGKGVPVDATDNPQMKLYALGAMEMFDYLFDIDTVMMTIYQPRIGNISTWRMSASELRRWAEEELRPLALLAFKGKGIRNSGDWCRFCKAKGDCPRLAAESIDTFELNHDAESLTPEEFSRILPKLDTIADWVGAVKERSLSLAVQGTEIPGYKVVEGRSIRKISDPGKLLRTLTDNGYPMASIVKPQELVTISELEKVVGKKKFKELSDGCIIKPKGKPTLVADKDKRKPMDGSSDFDKIDIQ